MTESRAGYSPFTMGDNRIPKLIRESMMQGAGDPFKPTADSFSVFSRLGAKHKPAIVSFGKVNQAIPFFGWYKVELEGQHASLGCFRINSNASPFSGTDFETILPGQRVIVMHWPGATVGAIVGVAPLSLYDAWVYRPDWITQGAGAGIPRNAAHNQGVKLKRNGGILDFSSGNPIDSNLLDRGVSFPTGMMLRLNPFLSFLRVSEICGLWINRFDHSARLAGKNLEIFSSAELQTHGSDQTERFLIVKSLIYPWESEGYLADAGDQSVTTADNDVWYKKLVGTVDRDPADFKVRSFGRVERYGGYLGQGGYEQVQAPAAGSTKNNAEHHPVGLATISKGLEGSLNLMSAHSIGLIKQLVLPAVHPIRDPADKSGDTSKGDNPNYRSNGVEGGGAEHKIKASLDDTSTAVDDEIAYIVWKAIHPFYYHKLDYYVPDDKDSVFGRSQEQVDYSPIAAGRQLEAPTPVQCRIDHRYGSVDYYRRSSFILLRPDGSIDNGDGSGVHWGARNGKFFIHAPDGVEIISGGRTTILSGEIIAEAHGSMDLSAGKDFRAAASEGNLQVVGKSVLLESLDEDGGYLFKDKVGEDVVATGVMIKSKTAIATWSDTVYMRSGVGTNEEGDIVIDAAQRKNSLIIHAKQTNYFSENGMNMWIGGVNQDTFDTFHTFGKTACEIGTGLIVKGKLGVVGDDAQAFVAGSIFASGTVSAGGKMADISGGSLAKVPDDYRDRLQDQNDKIEQQLEDALSEAADIYQQIFPDGLYSDQRVGNDDLIDAAGFSYRDDDDSRQYGSSGLEIEEPRWQRWLRLGLASGGKDWQQKSISYQGKDLYPWPGRKAWTENQVLRQTDAADIIDFPEGRASDRSDETGDTQPGTTRTVTLLGNLKVMIG